MTIDERAVQIREELTEQLKNSYSAEQLNLAVQEALSFKCAVLESKLKIADDEAREVDYGRGKKW